MARCSKVPANRACGFDGTAARVAYNDLEESSSSAQNSLPSNAPENLNVSLSEGGDEEEPGPSGEGGTGPQEQDPGQPGRGPDPDFGNPPVYNWQATKKTVKERFAFMFNNEVLSDVHFMVGRDITQQRIPAHKFVLSVGSAVFDAMFNGTLATDADEIELPDVEPAAFLALLRFLYSDEVQIGPETVMTTLYTAKKYAVPALECHCVDFLKSNLGADNAFMLLTQARLFDEPQLAALCLDTIDKNTAEAFSADGFTDVDLDTLCVVLERDTLRIREAKLFKAVLRWCEAECGRRQLPATPENKRTVLNSALSLIRFPLMSVEEFAIGPAQSGILTDREVVSLFLYFTVNPKPSISFKDAPRCSMTGKEQVVNRFLQYENRWGYSGTSDRIRFIVDRRIFVVGFGLYGSIHGSAEYEVNLQVLHTASGKVCGSNVTRFSCDGSCYPFRVMFKEPVEIIPNTSYTAATTLKVSPTKNEQACVLKLRGETEPRRILIQKGVGPQGSHQYVVDNSINSIWRRGAYMRRLRKQNRSALKGPDSYYGTKGLRKVTVDCPSDGKVTFQFTYAAGNNNGTSVEDGQIPEILFYT